MQIPYNAIILAFIIFTDYWFIFSRTSGIRISPLILFFIFLVFTTLNFTLNTDIMFDPLFFVALSFLFSKRKRWSEHIFNGFFATVLTEMIFRILGSLFIPVFLGISVKQLNSSYQTLDMAYALVLPATYILTYLFNFDLSTFRLLDAKELKKWLYFTNSIMVIYYLFFHYVLPIDLPWLMFLHHYRLILISAYLVFLTGIFIRLNRYVKDQLQIRLEQARTERIDNLKNYNDYIEQLYREIRMVKHDSENILLSLKDSINQGDLEEVSMVYQNVIKPSVKSLDMTDDNFGSLENIKESVIRSLINSKLMEAQQRGIKIHIEIPDKIEDSKIKLMDLISLMTYLLDTAIRTAENSLNAFLSVAYFTDENKHYFILENSTREKRVDLKFLFEERADDNQSIYLRNSQRFRVILDENPQLFFSIKSDFYRMRQILEMEK